MRWALCESGKEGEVTLEEDVELQGFGEPQCAKLIAEQVTAAFIACSTLQPNARFWQGLILLIRPCQRRAVGPDGECVFVGQVEEIEALKRRVQELEHMLSQKQPGGAVVA